MENVANVARYVHMANAWFVLVAGCVAVAVVLVETLHRGRVARGSLVAGLFAALLYVQLVLGGLVLLVTLLGRSELFGGNSSKALWHAVLGVVAAILGTLGLWARRRSWAIASIVFFVSALVSPNLARLIPIVLITAACWACAEFLWRRSRSNAISQKQPGAEE